MKNEKGAGHMEAPKVYTVEEVMEIMHLTKRTVYNYLRDGKLKAVKVGKYWRISQENLEEFIKTGTK